MHSRVKKREKKNQHKTTHSDVYAGPKPISLPRWFYAEHVASSMSVLVDERRLIMLVNEGTAGKTESLEHTVQISNPKAAG